MRWLTSLALVTAGVAAAPDPAAARPGLYLNLGFGGTEVDGANVPIADIPGLQVPPGTTLTTDNGDGVSGLLRLGFNFFGYAALEADVTFNGRDLEGDRRSWALHGQGGVRIYPMWYFQGWLPKLLQPLEPSLFWGWGLTYDVYAPLIMGNTNLPATEVGWRKIGSWRFGIGLEYSLFKHFTLGLDYNVAHASFDVFLFNFNNDIRADLVHHAPTTFHQVFLTIGFHGDPFGTPVPWEDEAPPPPPGDEGSAPAPEIGATIESEAAAESGTTAPPADTTPADEPESPPASDAPGDESGEGLLDI